MRFSIERRPEFLHVGKLCIAYQLTKRENPHRDFLDWYHYLAHILMEDCSFEEFPKNKLSFITYNYDRSLEFFLHRAIMHAYGKSPEEAAHVLKAIPIIHLHGSFGPLPYFDEEAVPYSTNDDIENLIKASASIKIIHELEAHPSGPEFRQARKLLDDAQRIGFLGFGYGKRNVKRLRDGTQDWVFSKPSRISGTCKGLLHGEALDIKNLFQGQIDLQDSDCLTFLRSTSILVTSS